jgi:hypothetical protein
MTKILDKDGAKAQNAIRVMIAVPSQDTCAVGFAHDLARMTGFMGSTRPDVQIYLFTSRGTLLPQQRTNLVKNALEIDATHILWLDSDMRFPIDTLSRLLAHNQRIVAANYTTRRPPITPTAAQALNQHVYTTDASTGLEEVVRCGMGCMLTEVDVFRTMDAPWFALGYIPQLNDFVGEDVFFCQKAKFLGIPTLIDHDLSKTTAHLGEFPYQHAHAMVAEQARQNATPAETVTPE